MDPTRTTRQGPLARWFGHFAKRVSQTAGRPLTFVAAVALILVWAVTGPIFGFNQTWQLVINTATTIITFLMVFVIQNTQNRDTAAIQLKLDELVRATKGAKNELIDSEDLELEELEELQARFERLARQARAHVIARTGRQHDMPSGTARATRPSRQAGSEPKATAGGAGGAEESGRRRAKRGTDQTAPPVAEDENSVG